MTIVIIKLIYFDRIKLLKSDRFVEYPNILSVYDSMVPTFLRVGFSNLFFKNDKDEVFEINDSEAFWAYITLEYPKASTHIDEVPAIVISVVVKNLNYLNSNDLTMHRPSICNSCGRKVAGIRYNCSACNNYDFCQYCEGQNIYSPSQGTSGCGQSVNNNSIPSLDMQHQLQTQSYDSKNEGLAEFNSDFKEVSSIEEPSDVEGNDKISNLSEESKKEKKEAGQCSNKFAKIRKDIKNRFEFFVTQNNQHNEKKGILINNECKYNVKQFIDFINELPYDFLVDQGPGDIDIYQYNMNDIFLVLEICLAKRKYGKVSKKQAKEIMNNFKLPSSNYFLKNICDISDSEALLSSDCSTTSEVSNVLPEGEKESNTSVSSNKISTVESYLTCSNVDISCEKVIDDIEPNDSVSMVGLGNSFNNVEVTDDTGKSNVSFSVITWNSNDAITSKKI